MITRRVEEIDIARHIVFQECLTLHDNTVGQRGNAPLPIRTELHLHGFLIVTGLGLIRTISTELTNAATSGNEGLSRSSFIPLGDEVDTVENAGTILRFPTGRKFRGHKGAHSLKIINRMRGRGEKVAQDNVCIDIRTWLRNFNTNLGRLKRTQHLGAGVPRNGGTSCGRAQNDHRAKRHCLTQDATSL